MIRAIWYYDHSTESLIIACSEKACQSICFQVAEHEQCYWHFSSSTQNNLKSFLNHEFHKFGICKLQWTIWIIEYPTFFTEKSLYSLRCSLEMEMECCRVLFALLRPWKGSSLAPNSKYFLNDTACGRYKYLCVE